MKFPLSCFPAPSDWAAAKRHPGFAHDWAGWAWVWLRLRAASLVEESPSIRQVILRRLLRDASSPAPVPKKFGHLTGCLIGSGGAAVTAALAVGIYSEFEEAFALSLRRWIGSAQMPRETDLMLGSAGALLACAEIEKHVPRRVPAAFVRDLVADCRRQLIAGLTTHKPVLLGLAHGLAGYLLALETAHVAFGASLPARLRRDCLDLLAEQRLQGPGGAAVWPKLSGSREVPIHGWCHGGPGIGLALLGGYRLTRLKEYRRLAEMALRGTAQFKSGALGFCCGEIGRAQILIESYRVAGDKMWLRKARIAAGHVRSASKLQSRGFHHGRLGYQYLLWRLKRPLDLPLPGLGVLSV